MTSSSDNTTAPAANTAANKGKRAATTALIVLDGWGHSDATEHNAIAAANTPNWDRLWNDAPTTFIASSGLDVGLPDGQMGNSEVGHMNLGAGRVVHQDLTRIDLAISDGSFHTNTALTSAIDKVRNSGAKLHCFGLLSPGGVHSHEHQINEFIRLAASKGVERCYLHAFLDGRDTPPRSASPSLQRSADLFAELYPDANNGRIASITGRYYAMDRDKRWDRVEQAWQLLVEGQSEHRSDSAINALKAAYARDENDEFVLPTAIASADQTIVTVDDGDVVVFLNYRSDRARELTAAFTLKDFDGFAANQPKLADFVTLTQYADNLPTSCAYPPEDLHNTLGEYLASQNKTQLRIAETEKYAHVTFFFSGGREAPFPGEHRELIPSPDVATYDLQPEMSAPELTDKLVAAIESGDYDTVICNYANGDMVGHSGVFDAAVKACETIDDCLARIVIAIEKTGGHCLITADHGNVEQMHDHATQQPHTAHTSEPVPLVYVGPNDIRLANGGTLSDIAPTLLALMGLDQPEEMTGRSLLANSSSKSAAPLKQGATAAGASTTDQQRAQN